MVLTVCLSFVAAGLPRPASAHAEHASEMGAPQVSPKSPMPHGVSLTVTKSTGFQFLLSTDGHRRVDVLADNGKPFLSIRGQSALADVHSIAWHRSLQPGGGAVPGAIKSGKKSARWMLIQDEPGYGWYDPRLNKDDVPQFTLRLRAEGKTWPIQIERKKEAVFSGFWQVNLTREPDTDSLSALVPGLSGNALMLARAPDSNQTFEVLDTDEKPFLKLGPEGVWLDTTHNWARQTGLYHANPAPNQHWVQLSSSNTITYLDPRLKPTQTSGHLDTSNWSIPVRLAGSETRHLIEGELKWRSTAMEKPNSYTK